jgi:hypothetical protein
MKNVALEEQHGFYAGKVELSGRRIFELSGNEA